MKFIIENFLQSYSFSMQNENDQLKVKNPDQIKENSDKINLKVVDCVI